MRSHDENLVAEQPGLSVFFIGLFVACVLGFLVRGLLSEDRIRRFVDQEISKNQKDFKIQVDHTSFQLANGPWPDFALVLRGIRLESLNPCWLSPSIDVTSVRFPLSIFDLFRGKISLPRIDVDQAVVLLRSSRKECPSELIHKTRVPQNVEVENPGIPKSRQAEAGRSETTTSVPDIKTSTSKSSAPKAEPRTGINSRPLEMKLSSLPFQSISVAKLRLNYLPMAFTTLEFQDIDLFLRSVEPAIFQAKGEAILGAETLSGDYASRAKWSLNVDPKSDPNGTLEINGAWREGRYDLQSVFNLETHRYDLNFNLNHLPLSQLFPLLKKYKVMLADFSGKQSWLSMKVESKGSYDHMTQAPWKLSEVKVEGDIGEVSTPAIEFKTLEPLVFSPVSLHISDLSLDALLVFLNRSHPSPALGQLGRFNGEALFQTPEQIQLKGYHSDFDLIFANNGSRQIQRIQKFRTEMTLSGQNWNGRIDEIQMERGQFEGFVEVHSSKNMKNFEIMADFKKLQLSPAVEGLMTKGGSAGVLHGQLKAGFDEGMLKLLEGVAQSDQIRSEGVEVKAPQLRIATTKGDFEIRAQGLELRLPTSLPILEQMHRPSEKLEFDQVTGIFKTSYLKDWHWKSIKMTSSQRVLQSQGGWDDKNNLYGTVEWTENGNLKKVEKAEKWNITGTREQPILLKKE